MVTLHACCAPRLAHEFGDAVHTHALPVELHAGVVPPQVPHEPPQPSLPQTLPEQFGVQAQLPPLHTYCAPNPWVQESGEVVQLHAVPEPLQVGVSTLHTPHEPPQPSLPHTLPTQPAAQLHAPEALHEYCAPMLAAHESGEVLHTQAEPSALHCGCAPPHVVAQQMPPTQCRFWHWLSPPQDPPLGFLS